MHLRKLRDALRKSRRRTKQTLPWPLVLVVGFLIPFILMGLLVVLVKLGLFP
jgi:hypothetical protein